MPDTSRHAPPIDAPLPDADRGNWVDRYIPAALRPWLRLGRFDRPAGVWLLMLPGWWGAGLGAAAQGRAVGVRLLVAFAVGAALMRAAGCAYNDLVDRDIDRLVARTAARPLASGVISPRGAVAFLVGLSLAAFLVLLTLGPLAIGLGVASLVLVAAYPFMKRITWWPQAWLGLTFNWGALMAWAAATGAMAPPALWLYAAGVAWTLGYDTLYALQDLEDDALAGVRSSARRLGRHARRGVALFYAASAALSLAALATAHARPLAYAAWAAWAAHLGWQAARARVDDPALALRLFKSNRDAGLLLFAACALAVVRV